MEDILSKLREHVRSCVEQFYCFILNLMLLNYFREMAYTLKIVDFFTVIGFVLSQTRIT